MRTYAFDFSSQHFGQIFAYATRRQAEAAGNGRVLAASEADIAAASVSISHMVQFYNVQADAAAKHFTDRAYGAKKLFALALAKAVEVPKPEEKMEPTENVKADEAKAEKPKKEKKAKVEKSAKAEGAAAGRLSKFAGTVIKALSSENPRREGSEGWHSFEIVLKAGKAGISYEAFVEAGGKRNQLDWDIKHDFVELHAPAEAAAA